MKNVLLMIRESMSDFSPLERKIASYILENKNQTIQLSIRDIAEHCDISQAAVVRFCKQLGFSGFKELRRHLTSDVLSLQSERQDPLQFPDITNTKDIHSIADTIISNHTQSMLETGRLINYADLERAVGLIAAAPRVDFYGVGASGLVALDAQQKFLRIGKICNAHSDSHVQITMAANLAPNDVAVAISYSGATKDLLETVSAAKQSGARVIAITRYSQANPLSALADITLYTASSELLIRSGSTSSRIAQLTMIDILFIGMASLSPDEYNPKLERTHKLASKRKALE